MDSLIRNTEYISVIVPNKKAKIYKSGENERRNTRFHNYIWTF